MDLHHDAARALLALAELPRVGDRRLLGLQVRARARHLPLSRLIELPAAVLRNELGLPPVAVQRLTAARAWHEARCATLANALLEHGVRLCPLGDAEYPRAWRHHGDPPPALAYLHGDAGLLHRPVVALLHSRTIDAETVAATVRLTRAAVAAGCAVAVGGMKTTHRLATGTARALGGARLVVLDRGLLAAFDGRLDRDPFGFGPNRLPFDRSRTLALSPFRPGDHALPRSGARRDGLIAALADLVIAVHARPGGEIERHCLRALRRGQAVAVWQEHNTLLLAAGARPLREADLGTVMPRA